MSYQVKLDAFEGPLDLLLHLIDKNEMDIYDISIAKITEQYLQYIETMQTLKLDVTSEFLVMAATLLSIKSKLLLPSREEDIHTMLDLEEEYEDPRQELVERLIEYKKYKQLAEDLKEKELARSMVYTRSPSDLSSFMLHEEENPVEGMSLYHLFDAMERVLRKQSYRQPLTRVEREEISIKEKINQLQQLLKEKSGKIYFSELITNHTYKEDIVITFLSILELMKRKSIICIQHETFDDILIYHSPEDGGKEDEL